MAYLSVMFRDLGTRISTARRSLAWAILLLLLAGSTWALPHFSASPLLRRSGDLILWACLALAGIRLLSFALLDPLLRNRRTAGPGFARDLLVVLLYIGAAGLLGHFVLRVDLGALLGTGAIAAAVVGLSLQEVLGNLFAGISLQLDPAFQVGDWLEITGNLRGGPGRESLVGQVVSMTWRAVQLRTENGDTDIFPNRILAQAVVTNLHIPTGLHRRTARVIVEPHPELHLAMEKLSQALGGIPHLPGHRPEVVAHSFEMGGAVLEMRWWALGFRHGRQGNFQAVRLAATVLPREGFSLLGPHGATTPHHRIQEPSEADLRRLLEQLHLPLHWAGELKGQLSVRHAAPGEGLIREGDPGESLFAVLSGSLKVVRAVERQEPYSGLYWESIAELGPGAWFGEASLLTGAPRNATVVAESSCKLLELPKAAFEGPLKADPQVMESLVDLMETRSRSAPSEGSRGERRARWTEQIRSWLLE